MKRTEQKAISVANLLADFGRGSRAYSELGQSLGGDVRTYHARVVRGLADHVAPERELHRGLDLPDPEGVDRIIASLGYARAAPGMEGDPLGALYQDLVPARERHANGEYYTPPWLADHLLDLVGHDGDPDLSVLDPACGSGAFLVRAIQRIMANQRAASSALGPSDLALRICANVAGHDRNPLAVLTARVNVTLALGDLARRLPLEARVQVEQADALEPPETDRRYRLVVGNPPWINWAQLAPTDRERSAPLWQEYGIFTHRGYRQKLGGAMDDLSALMLYLAADRRLHRAGTLGFVITKSVFHSEGGGRGFRRFELRPGQRLKVERVEDLSAIQPFEGASTRTALVVVKKGAATTYPVPYGRWRRDRTVEELSARPVLERDRTSPWIVGERAALRGAARCSGGSAYEGQSRCGVHTHCNGVFWVEDLGQAPRGGRVIRNLGRLGRPAVPEGEAVVEPGCLYPLLRGRDVSRWSAAPARHMVLAQDPERPARALPEGELASRYPGALAYLTRHEQRLRQRSGFRRFFKPEVDPFYSVYNVGPYTFAPHKVVWREQAAVLTCAVIGAHQGRLVIPDHKLNLCPFDDEQEAHYLCAFLSSTPARYMVKAYTLETSVATHLLKYLRVPRFDAALPDHRALAEASREGHRAAARADDDAQEKCLATMDAAVSHLWDLSAAEMEAMAAGLRHLSQT